MTHVINHVTWKVVEASLDFPLETVFDATTINKTSAEAIDESSTDDAGNNNGNVHMNKTPSSLVSSNNIEMTADHQCNSEDETSVRSGTETKGAIVTFKSTISVSYFDFWFLLLLF